MEKEYRTEIDGLRAVAVFSVILFHATNALPGGFVGVDVFFVISGYLISGILRREFESGSFSILRFWERRIRRILPAATVTVTISLFAGYFLFLSNDLKDLGKSAIASTFFSSNFYFWQTVDYFTDTVSSLPLLHTWSLAVEEQFYLIFPVVLWLVYRKTESSKTNRNVSLLVLVFFFVSLILSVIGVYLKPQATFYLLPTRAWELFLGVGVAYFPKRFIPTRDSIREVMSWTGLGMIGLSVMLFSEDIPFPGLSALVPCLGAALLLIGDEHTMGTRATSAARFLSNQWLVYVGKISYSLYLYHWPILVYAKYSSGEPLSFPVVVSLILLLFCLASASFFWLEQPIRQRRVLASRKSLFTFAVLSSTVIAMTGLMIWQVIPSRYESLENTVNKFISERVNQSVDKSVEQIKRDEVKEFGESDDGRVSFLLLGDSHARMSIPAFEDFANENRLRFAAITWSSVQPLVEYRDPSPNAKKIDSIAWVNSALDYASRHNIGTLVLVAKWEDVFTDLGRLQFQQLLAKTVVKFQDVVHNLYLMIDVPGYQSSVPRQLIHDSVVQTKIADWMLTPEEYDSQNEPLLAFVDELKRLNVKILDPRSFMLDRSNNLYIVSYQGSSIYSDAHHLTIPASRQYLGEMLRNQFQP